MTATIADRTVREAHHELYRLLDMGQAPALAVLLRIEFVRLAVLGTDNAWLVYGAPEALELAAASTGAVTAALGFHERGHLRDTLHAAGGRRVPGTWMEEDAYAERLDTALSRVKHQRSRSDSHDGDNGRGGPQTADESRVSVDVPTVIGLVGSTAHPIYRGLTSSSIVRLQVEVLSRRQGRGSPELTVEGVTGNGTREAFVQALDQLDEFGSARAPRAAQCVCHLTWDRGGMITGRSATTGFLLGAAVARSRHAPGPFEWRIQPGVAISADLEGTRLRPVDSATIPQKVHACRTGDIDTLVVAHEQTGDFLAQVLSVQNEHPGWQLRVTGVEDLKDLFDLPYVVAPSRRRSRDAVASWISWLARSTTVLVSLAMIVSLGVGLSAREWVRGRNEPVSVELDQHGMFLTNKYGRTAGRIELDGIAPIAGMKLHLARSVDVHDLNGDGHRDILVMVKDPKGETRELLALDRHGNTLWHVFSDSTGAVAPDIEAGVGWRGFHIFDRDEHRAAVLAFRRSRQGSFTAVEVLDGASGQILGQVTNWGHLEALNIVDLERDGTGEYVIGGTENKSSKALVAVLDPEKLIAEGIVPGTSTPPSLLDPTGLNGAIPLCLRLAGDSFIEGRRPSLMEAKEEGRYTTFVVSPDIVGYDLFYRFVFREAGPPVLQSLQYGDKAKNMQREFSPPVQPEQREAELKRLASEVEILTPKGFVRLAP